MDRPAPTSEVDVRRALRSAGAYPYAVDHVEVVETHISHVFLAGDRVYKVKKPLRLAFLDASTLARRERLCREEVRLNRRLAEGVYLGVVPITVGDDGAVRVGGSGTAVEFAVEMTRLPADRMLDARLERGEVDNDLVERIVERLVRFHAAASRGPEVDAYGRPEAVRTTVRGNLEELVSGVHVSARRARHLQDWLEQRLRRHVSTMARRVEEGRVREGHGDLHAGNICVLEERIVAYDCIEFEPAFRCLDVAAEVAFLTMDLMSRGFAGFAERLARRYAALAEDEELLELLPLYQVHYALVRAKVAGLLADDEGADPATREVAAHRSSAAIDLAVRISLPPFVILTCGLPGSGKSTAARAVGDALEAHVLRSDVERKRLAGIPPLERRPSADERGLYAPEWTDRVYTHLLARADELLDRGRSVIVDAAFPTAARRAAFVDLARRRETPLVVLHLATSEEVAVERLRRREAEGRDASDADERVRAAARGRFEEPGEIPDRQLLEFRQDDPLEDLPHRFVERLILAASDPPRSPS